MRDIAAKVPIDPALVIRYFGSKDELFVRAAAFDLRMPDLSKVKRSQTSNAKGELSARARARYGV